MTARTLIRLLALVATPFALAADPPVRVDEPAIPADLAARGVAYHTISGQQAQVTFTSDAPLQDIVGKSNAVVGWVVVAPGDAPSLVAGRWLLPVASLATGIPLRDEHLAGDHWLDAAAHPVIAFELERTEDVVTVKTGTDFNTVTATLVGTLEMHGMRRPLRVEKAKLSFLEASDRTKAIAPGDLVFIQCAYDVKLSEFGVVNGDVPGKVADTIRLDQILRLTTDAAAVIRTAPTPTAGR